MNKRVAIDSTDFHYFKVDSSIIRIMTRTKGFRIAGTIHMDPDSSAHEDGHEETLIEAMDVKLMDGWACFDDSIRKAQAWHGMSFEGAEKHGMESKEEIKAYHIYEIARRLIEENAFFDRYIPELMECYIPKEDRL